MNNHPVNVLFVCLGNICRSPTAHGIFQQQVADAGLEQQIYVDSCGTGDWHIGEQPDPRATRKAMENGYDLSVLRARQISPDDFNRFQLILAMDNENLQNLDAICPADFAGKLDLFLRFSALDSNDVNLLEVPDPYFGGEDGFNEVLTMVERASARLLKVIRNHYL